MSGSVTFTWVAGQDINGPNNWLTPLNWTIAPASQRPDRPPWGPTSLSSGTDNGSQDAIISGGQAISRRQRNGQRCQTVGAISGRSPARGRQRGRQRDWRRRRRQPDLRPAPSSSRPPTRGGAIVGGINGVITAPTMIVGGGRPDQLPC